MDVKIEKIKRTKAKNKQIQIKPYQMKQLSTTCLKIPTLAFDTSTKLLDLYLVNSVIIN